MTELDVVNTRLEVMLRSALGGVMVGSRYIVDKDLRKCKNNHDRLTALCPVRAITLGRIARPARIAHSQG